MKTVILILVALLMGGCSVFVDVSAGAPLGDTRMQKYVGGDTSMPTRDGFAGSGAIVRASIEAHRQYTERLSGYCQVSHTSNSHSGWPFNGEPEGYIHEAGCGARFKIW